LGDILYLPFLKSYESLLESFEFNLMGYISLTFERNSSFLKYVYFYLVVEILLIQQTNYNE